MSSDTALIGLGILAIFILGIWKAIELSIKLLRFVLSTVRGERQLDTKRVKAKIKGAGKKSSLIKRLKSLFRR